MDSDKITLLIQSLCIATAIVLFIKGIWMMGKNKSKQETNLDVVNDYVKMNTTKLKKKVEKEVNCNYLTSCTWQLFSDGDVINYIFRSNSQLLISKNGNIEKASYEYLVDNNSIIIETEGKSELWNIISGKDNFLFLNKVSTNKIFFFYNQTKIKDEVLKEISKYEACSKL